jgi:hypothetical protein
MKKGIQSLYEKEGKNDNLTDGVTSYNLRFLSYGL